MDEAFLKSVSIYRGSYMSVHVLLKIKRVWEKDKKRGFAGHRIGFSQRV